jgi:hypothetical protein
LRSRGSDIPTQVREEAIIAASKGLKVVMADMDAEDSAFNIINGYEEAAQRGVTLAELDDLVEEMARHEFSHHMTEGDSIDAVWDVINSYKDSIGTPEFVA